MNKIKITLCGIGLLCFLFMLPGCNGDTDNHDNSAHKHEHGDDHSHDKDDHAHIYTCPMKCPGSQSDKPGKCPVCGMELEHSDKPLDESDFHINFKTNPKELVAGGAGTLYYTPKKDGYDDELVPLELHHEKKIHLMILSKDLSYFEHIHPKYDGEGYQIKVIGKNESFTKERGLDETQFTHGGEYIMYVDYVPAGATGQLDKIPLIVGGTPIEKIELGNQNLNWAGEGYKVELSSDKNLTVNTPVQLKIHITNEGNPVNDLGTYLGALAHMVVLSEDTEGYLHVHPLDSETNGPDILLNTKFPKAGKYKVYMQFNHNGKVRTTNFVVEVGE